MFPGDDKFAAAFPGNGTVASGVPGYVTDTAELPGLRTCTGAFPGLGTDNVAFPEHVIGADRGTVTLPMLFLVAVPAAVRFLGPVNLSMWSWARYRCRYSPCT